MIKFTIVTCTYNAEAVLQRTLDSVMKQTYCNIEHLIIDGVSKDKTLTMVKAYQHKNDVGESAHEILVFSEPDKGLYDAMNKGIDRATGDYLIFLNAGDVFPSEDTLEFVEGCRRGRGTAGRALWRYRHREYGWSFLAPSSSDSSETSLLAQLYVGYAGLSSVVLCSCRHSQRHPLQSRLSFLGGCRLVHPHHARGSSSPFAFAQCQCRHQQLPGWWHVGAES